MPNQRAPKERQINTFKKPFDSEHTPYTVQDFHVVVKDFCKEAKTNHKLKIAKTIFIGDMGVGKTSLINRFREKKFITQNQSTIGVNCFLEGFDVLGVPFNLQIWDTAGQERFRCIASPYFRGTSVVILVFDLSNLDSLSHCERWLDTALLASRAEQPPYVVLVGNKSDSISKKELQEIKKTAVFIAAKLKSEFWIVSSKTGDNVENLFRRVALLAFEWMVLKDMEVTEDVNLLQLSVETLNSFQKNKRCTC